MRKRHETKPVSVGGITIGGQNRVVLQSMTTTKTENIDATIEEINRLATLGAELVRVAIVDERDAAAIKTLKANTTVPLVADIHFDYRLALKAVEAGIDKLRINPGNIGTPDKVKAVVEACKAKSVPIRIGVNAGSLERDLLETHGRTATAMVESAKRHVALLEAEGFTDIIISLKASDVALTIDSYRLAAETFPYPLHLGLTEAGPVGPGAIKSAMAMGPLLLDGIGDTLRVSISGDRADELRIAKTILANAGLYEQTNLVACPTCGRLDYDMMSLLNQVESYLETHPTNLTIAVMGCAVNGPGEARDADIGIAGGKQEGLLFAKGKIVKKVPQENLFEAFVELVESIK